MTSDVTCTNLLSLMFHLLVFRMLTPQIWTSRLSLRKSRHLHRPKVSSISSYDSFVFIIRAVQALWMGVGEGSAVAKYVPNKWLTQSVTSVCLSVKEVHIECDMCSTHTVTDILTLHDLLAHSVKICCSVYINIYYQSHWCFHSIFKPLNPSAGYTVAVQVPHV